MHDFCRNDSAKYTQMVEMKENILSTATNRMQQVGIRSVSIDDLCHELGISKKTFYVHFQSKDDLVDAILLSHEKKMETSIQHLVERKTVVQCIVDWTKITQQTEKCSHQAPPLLYDLQKYYPQLYKTHRSRIRRAMKTFLMQFLRKGQDEKIFRKEIDVEVVALLFVNAHLMTVDQAQADKLTAAETRYLGKQTMDVLLRGVFTQEGLRTLEIAVHGI